VAKIDGMRKRGKKTLIRLRWIIFYCIKEGQDNGEALLDEFELHDHSDDEAEDSDNEDVEEEEEEEPIYVWNP